MTNPAESMASGLRDTGKKMAEGGATIGVKMIDQAETNVQEAFSAMRAAAQASDINEVMRIQAEYMRKQGERSMTQAREIGELIMQLGRDAVSGVRGDGNPD